MARTPLTELARRLKPVAVVRPVLIILGVGTFMAILGPFGSHWHWLGQFCLHAP
jgi:hypothetical protein